MPLDGIGLQTHTHILGFHDEATLASTMRRFAAMGLQVQVTEMDVGTSLLARRRRRAGPPDAPGRGLRRRRARLQRRRACSRFTTWGITDRLSWLGAGESALLFDSRLRPKPAYAAVRSAFAPRRPALAPAAQPRRWRWRPGTGARCGWGSCSGLRAGRG